MGRYVNKKENINNRQAHFVQNMSLNIMYNFIYFKYLKIISNLGSSTLFQEHSCYYHIQVNRGGGGALFLK